MKPDDEKYMQGALKLARRGIGSVEPNPAVGCVIVKGNQIAGKGWHRKFGAPHAEINALEDCKNLGLSPESSTIYVTLEPCSHHGKTPPCTDAIIESRPARVVVAAIDPSEHANGAGIQRLRDAGIEVETGICETEARLLNGPFLKFAATGRCWTILKWAQTIDGKLAWADKTGERRWISNEFSRKDVQTLRKRAQAIVVGINTILTDDPLLTARPAKGKTLTRVVLDTRLSIPLDCQLLATARKAPVLILTSRRTVETEPHRAEQIRSKGAELLIFADTPGLSNLHFLIDELSERGVAQLLVEGGPTVIASFLRERLADEFSVYISPLILGGRGKADIAAPLAQLTESLALRHVNIQSFHGDVCIRGLSAQAAEELSIL